MACARDRFFDATVTEDGDGYGVPSPRWRSSGPGLIEGAAALALLLGAAAAASAQPAPAQPLPRVLSDTGLFRKGSVHETRPGIMSFSPQYPLWSDGAAKRRWIQLPAGHAIDASRPDAWDFPPGTKFWKEFSLGRPVETRLIERLAGGSWRFASYVWNEEGTEAVLAPREGLPSHSVDGRRYSIPSETDCRACHEGAAAPILGFSALQLSPDRDPLAPHREPAAKDHIDLPQLVEGGWLSNLPKHYIAAPPRIAASSPTERAALGYLHANCGHCHDRPSETTASVPVEAILAQKTADATTSTAEVLRSLISGASRYRTAGSASGLVVPGAAHASLLPQRMRARDPFRQMPPLGTAIPDEEAIALIERWINQDLSEAKAP
jgi:hypothetical protein